MMMCITRTSAAQCSMMAMVWHMDNDDDEEEDDDDAWEEAAMASTTAGVWMRMCTMCCVGW